MGDRYECDCGAVYSYPDGPINCAATRHGSGDNRDARIAELEAEVAASDALYAAQRETIGQLQAEVASVRENRDRLVRELDELRQALEAKHADFAALQHALVGDTGASAILTASTLQTELARLRSVMEQMGEALELGGSVISNMITYGIISVGNAETGGYATYYIGEGVMPKITAALTKWEESRG